ncbi:MAG: helix-turn-helix transcriptional regulator [Paracoccaceae bacterium]
MSAQLFNDLVRLRKNRGWTQAELAEQVGVSRKTINTIENAIYVPSTVLALQIAAALDVPIETVFWLPSDAGPKG